MNADWKDSLASLLSSGDLPEGEAAEAKPEAPVPWPKLAVTLDRRKGGKIATIVSGFDPDDERCSQLAATLKKRLACGGSSRGGEILIQGDRLTQVKAIIKEICK